MKLYEHQQNALLDTQDKNKVAYYHDMGLGKTFTGSAKMVQLGKRINIVVCQKSKIRDWIEHFRSNHVLYATFDLTSKISMKRFISWANTDDVLELVGVINYDLVWRRPELLELEDFTLMLDESSLIQNETSKRSKFILKLNAKNVILLSGTPTGGKYENLWSQLHLLGWNISKKLYWKQYIDTEVIDSEGYPITVVRGYKNVERLKRKMRQYGCHFLMTEDVLDLPEKIDNKISIETTKAYRQFRKDCIVEILFGEFGDVQALVGDTTLTKMLYERQLCGQYNATKLKAFQDLLESTYDRLIVFYNFTEELNAMQHICEVQNRVYSIVNGKTKDLYAYEHKSDSVTFVQYQAGAMGLNLQLANKIIYFTLPLSSELFEQSKKRIHRIGQKNNCFYYYLICKNSIEEKIYATLEMRRDYTEDLFKESE